MNQYDPNAMQQASPDTSQEQNVPINAAPASGEAPVVQSVDSTMPQESATMPEAAPTSMESSVPSQMDAPQSTPVSAAPTVETVPPQQDPLTQAQPNAQYEPVNIQPAGGGSKTFILVLVLIILLIGGGFAFAVWQNWFNLGSLLGFRAETPVVTENPVTDTEPTAPAQSPATLRDNQRKSDLAKLKAALKQYYSVNQTYPVTTAVEKTSDSSTSLVSLLPSYISEIPKDPLSTYYYGYKSDGTTFEITAVLEDATDSSGTKSGSYNIYKVTDSSIESTSSAGTSTSTTDTSLPGGDSGLDESLITP